jgi:hypothetical protein
MKLTKFNLVSISLVAMMSVSSVSFAQNCKKVSSKELAEKKTEIMKECLDLSKKQTKQVYQINLNYIVAKKAQRPGFAKDGKHFKGAVCPPAKECPGTGFDKDKPQRPCPQAKPNCKPQMKPGCNGPAGKPQMRPECEKPKCDTSFMKGKPNQTKGCKPGFKPDSITCKYHNDLKQVLTASQYDKWMKIKCERMKNHNNGHKPIPCPR